MSFLWKSRDARYFWTGWFDGQSFLLLAGLYVLLSATDLVATMRLIPLGVREGNPLAHWMLTQYGMFGFAGYKFVLVAIVLIATRLIDRQHGRLARILLWSANIAMGYLAILHLALLITLMMRHASQ